MNNKDKEKKVQIKTILDKKDSLIPKVDGVYYPNFYNTPEQNISVFKFNDTHLLSKGGIMTLCAKSGIGKSSVMEAFISSHLNAESDSLGINLFLQEEHSKILFIDTERSKWEVHCAWSKLMKRAFLTDETETHLKLIYASVKRLNVEQKRQYIDSILELNNDIGLVVFDGASDFLNNTNDMVESNKFIEWINNFNDNIALAFTIHTNPTDDKPRGHLGSELCRKSESVLNANRQGDIYEITTDFENGKNRHGKHNTWNYKYCEELDMFISTTDKPIIKKPSTPIQSKHRDLAIKIFGETDALSYAHIIEQIQKCATKTPQQAKDIFMSGFKDKLIERIIIQEQPFWKLIKQ
jgi:hypothetical protein